MKLPYRENAFIPPSKIYDYLLSKTNPVGMWKARLFRSFGFDESNANLMEYGLLSIANSEEVIEIIPSLYGTKYAIDGLLQTPVGRFLQIRTIWIIDTGEIQPRFVTAYPL